MNFNSWNWESENWGGDPEGPLAKALEKAREKNEERKPLKIERLPKKQDSLEMISCPYCEEFGGGEVPTNFDYDSGDMWSPATLEITEWEMCEYCEGEGKVEDNEEYQKIPKWDWSYLEPDEPEYDRYYDAEATNIDWETDGQEVDLPKKVKVPDDLDADEIADYLSDEYDFLVNSFQIKDAESFEAEPETWAPGESLPPSVISLIKEYIESGQNPKGIASILPKLLKMVDVEKQNRGKLVLELAKEAKNYYVHHLFYVVVKKEGQVMPNVIHRTFNLEKAIDYAERLWSDGIYEDVEVDCPGAETVVWMNGNLEDAWLELNAESFEAEIGDTIICIKDDPNGYFKKGDRAKYLKFEDQIDRYYDLNDNYIGPLQYKVKLLHNKNEFVVTPEIVDRYWRVVNEAESFETDVDWEGKPYTGQINPDDQDLDEQKADRNKDGKLSSWERAIGNQVARGIREGGYGAEDCLVCGAEGFEACEYHSEEFELHDWYDPMSDYGMMEYHPEIQEQKSQYLDDLEEQKDSYEREQRREIIKSKDIDDRIRMIDQAVANQEKGVKRHLKGRFQNPITVLATKGGLDRYDFIKIGIFALLIGAVGVKVASK